MDIQFYQENDLWKFTDVFGVSQGIPLGMPKWSVNDSRLSIRIINEPEWLFYGESAPLKIPTKSKVELRVTNISANDGAVVGKFQIQKVTENEQF